MKIIYAFHRKAYRTRDHFVRRWRWHGAFAMTMPSFFSGVDRYIHNDGAVPPDGADDFRFFDAVGELHYRSLDHVVASMQSDELRSAIKLDGDELFDRSQGFTAAVEDRLLLRRGPSDFALFAFVQRAAGVDAAAFRARWLAESEAALSALLADGQNAPIMQAVLSHPVDIGISLSDIDGVLQLGCNALDDGAAIFRATLSDIRTRLGPAGEGMRVTSIIARPRVLYDRAHVES